jgi:hypothetical protein
MSVIFFKSYLLNPLDRRDPRDCYLPFALGQTNQSATALRHRSAFRGEPRRRDRRQQAGIKNNNADSSKNTVHVTEERNELASSPSAM